MFNVGSRVVMNWSGVWRSRWAVIRQYEERNGEIQIQRGGPAPARAGRPEAGRLI